MLAYHLFAIFIGWYFMTAQFQYSGKKYDSNFKEDYIKIISYNVRNFGLYNYNKKDWSYNTKHRDSIFHFLSIQNADIICFQEFVNVNNKLFKTVDTLVSFLKTSHIHAEYSVTTIKNNSFGLATLSTYPIISGGKITFPGNTNNFCMYSDILYKKDTIRIYNLHFESIHLSKEDYKFAEELSKEINLLNNEKIEHHSKQIFSRIKEGFIARAGQVDIIVKHILQSPYPVILCGDFNDTPCSYTYHKIAKLLKDAFVESGSGLGTTYAGIFPSFRIDYIMYSNNFKSLGFTTFRVKYSDHYPIMCYLKFNKTK